MISFQEEFAERIYANPKFRQDFSDLLKYQFLNYFKNGNVFQAPESSQIKRLIESSLIMASSPNEQHKRVAFELATIFYEGTPEELPGLKGVMKLICTRLGHIPGVHLIDEDDVFLPPSLNVESEACITENSVR